MACGSIEWGRVFEQAAWALVEEHRRACGDAGAGVEEASASLATTLLVAAVRGSDVQLAAVGDSPAFVLKGKDYDAVVGEPERLTGWSGAGWTRSRVAAGAV